MLEELANRLTSSSPLFEPFIPSQHRTPTEELLPLENLEEMTRKHLDASVATPPAQPDALQRALQDPALIRALIQPSSASPCNPGSSSEKNFTTTKHPHMNVLEKSTNTSCRRPPGITQPIYRPK